eukprot:m.19722 g.19722  ORF g.19722 m.19722 type:complete len:1315 (-) comp6659_c0_seq1:628-4572(-)
MAAQLEVTVTYNNAAVCKTLFDSLEAPKGWLQTSFNSMSVRGVIAIGTAHRVVVLKEIEGQMTVVGVIPSLKGAEHPPGTTITAVHCMPPMKCGSEDLVNVAVGYSNGFIRIFSQMGEPLISEMLHEAPVVMIQTQRTESVSDLVILFPKVIVVLDGFSLGQLLRACIKRVKEGGDLHDFDSIPLALKKWGISSEQDVHDIVCLGQGDSSAYDTLLQGQKISRPIHKYISGGFRPMISVYSTRGCENTPFFSAKALASTVANKLGTAMLSVVTSFWGGSSQNGPPKQSSRQKANATQTDSTQELSEAAKEAATALTVENSLEDTRRHIRTLDISPDLNLIAMTDDFGRVLLYNVPTNTISRVWKGYRDAQSGWVTTLEKPDETDPSQGTRADSGASRLPPKRCMFLVILAPKRHILEVWTPALGKRVAAFNLEPECSLLTLRDQRLEGGINASCFVVSPSGTIKSVTVPFESALSRSLNSQTQDRYQIRRIQSILSNVGKPDFAADTIPDIESRVKAAIMELRSAKALSEVLNMICNENLSQRTIEFLVATAEKVFESFREKTEDVKKDPSQLLLSKRLNDMKASMLVHRETYKLLKSTRLCHLIGPIPTNGEFSLGLDAISLGEAHDQEIKNFLSACISRIESNAKESDPQPVSVSLGTYLNFIKLKGDGKSPPFESTMDPSALPDEIIFNVSRFLFQSSLADGYDAESHVERLKNCGLGLKNIWDLLVHFCFTLPLWSFLKSPILENLRGTMYHLLSWSCEEFSQVSVIELIKERCSNCSAVSHALVTAVMARSVIGKADDLNLSIARLLDVLCLRLAMGSDIMEQGIRSSSHESGFITESQLQKSKNIHSLITSTVLKLGLHPTHLLSETCLNSEDFLKAGDFQENVEKCLALLRLRFPITTSLIPLAFRCADDLIKRWEFDMESTNLLLQAVDFLIVIPDKAVKAFTLNLLWAKVFKLRMGNLVALIEKVGKPPKERLCQKPLSKGGLELGARATCNFALAARQTLVHLNTLMDTSNRITIVDLKSQDIRWSANETIVDGLLESALQSSVKTLEFNTGVVEQHTTLSHVVFYVMYLEIRSVRPFSLFAENIRSLFFSPMEASQIEPGICKDEEDLDIDVVHEDPGKALAAASVAELRSARRQFLSRALAIAISAKSELSNAGVNVKIGASEIFELAAAFSLDKDDVLLRQYVCNLFQAGLDSRVDDAVLRVENTGVLATSLLEVAGRRLALLMDQTISKDALSLVSRIPGDVYEWCTAVNATESLPGDVDCVKVNLQAVQNLAQIVEQLAVPESAASKRVAQLLAALQAL